MKIEQLINDIRNNQNFEQTLTKKFSLDRLKLFLNDFDRNLYTNLPPIVHVAGTNGKGSTIAFQKSILNHMGLKCHVYTSPHLIDWNERIVIRDQKIAIDDFYHALHLIYINSKNYRLSVFETITATAFYMFSKTPADMLLLEVGMGGRLDATNIINHTKVSVITPISYDHQEYLGNDLESISFEKAGIIKMNCPVVASKQSKSVNKVLLDVSKQIGSRCYCYEDDWYFDKTAVYINDKKILWPERLGLIGDHQYINAATAVVSLVVAGINLDNTFTKKALEEVCWPGRMEKIAIKNCGEGNDKKGHEFWVDGAHNQAGAQILKPILAKWSKKSPVYLIVAMKRDKNAQAFLKIVSKFVTKVFLTTLPDQMKDQKNEFYQPMELANFLPKGVVYEVFSSWFDAKKAIEKQEDSSMVLITGSLYLVGDVLRVTNG
jgi:dihydrofolate synthase/folylpolyglutamate synthase